MADDLDGVYKRMPAAAIPWNIETPPEALVELVSSRRITPCRAVDLGCGAGNNSIYLAQQGFDVTGVDISPTAITIAEENAKKKRVSCRFVTADVLGDLSGVGKGFQFAFDWELLHHIPPEKRGAYVRNVFMLLEPDGTYFSVTFSVEDKHFGGKGKVRTTPIGTTLYFSSENEIRQLLSPYFYVRRLRTITIRGKPSPHLAICAISERRPAVQL